MRTIRLLVCLVLAVLPVLGQIAASTVRGTVNDASGGAVVGAEITLVNLETNIKRVTQTNESGDYES